MRERGGDQSQVAEWRERRDMRHDIQWSHYLSGQHTSGIGGAPLHYHDLIISVAVITKQNIDPITEMLGCSLSDKWSYYFKHCVSNCSDDSIPGPGRHRNCFTGLRKPPGGRHRTRASSQTHKFMKNDKKKQTCCHNSQLSPGLLFPQISYKLAVRHWLDESTGCQPCCQWDWV